MHVSEIIRGHYAFFSVIELHNFSESTYII